MIEAHFFPNRFVRGYPDNDDPRCVRADVAQLLTYRHPDDAHFAAYAADLTRRVKVSLLREPRHASKVCTVNLRMVLTIHPFSSSSAARNAAIASAPARSLASPREMVMVPGGPPEDLPV